MAAVSTMQGTLFKARSISAELTLMPLGIAALTLDGVKIDVPTHRVIPPPKFPLPTTPGLQRAAFAVSDDISMKFFSHAVPRSVLSLVA